MSVNCSVGNCCHNHGEKCKKDTISVGKSKNVVGGCCDTECDSFEH